jgi:hypothetical protein
VSCRHIYLWAVVTNTLTVCEIIDTSLCSGMRYKASICKAQVGIAGHVGCMRHVSQQPRGSMMLSVTLMIWSIDDCMHSLPAVRLAGWLCTDLAALPGRCMLMFCHRHTVPPALKLKLSAIDGPDPAIVMLGCTGRRRPARCQSDMPCTYIQSLLLHHHAKLW